MQQMFQAIGENVWFYQNKQQIYLLERLSVDSPSVHQMD